MAKPKYIQDEAPIDSDECNSTAELAETVNQIAALQKAKRDTEQQMKRIADDIEKLEKRALDIMDDAGIEEFKTAEGAKAAKKRFISARVQDDVAFYNELVERGEAGLAQVAISAELVEVFRVFVRKTQKRELATGELKLTIHHKRLESYVRERGDTAVAGVNVKEFVTVKVR